MRKTEESTLQLFISEIKMPRVNFVIELYYVEYRRSVKADNAQRELFCQVSLKRNESRVVTSFVNNNYKRSETRSVKKGQLIWNLVRYCKIDARLARKNSHTFIITIL